MLTFGKSAEIEDACRELIETREPDGGFSLGQGCAMGTETPAENIYALVENAKKYGEYKIDYAEATFN